MGEQSTTVPRRGADAIRSFEADGPDTESAAGVLFLRAERGDGGRRPYRLAVARPLSTSLGIDLYDRFGGSLGNGSPG